MHGAVGRFLSLDNADQRLLLRAIVWLAGVDVALRFARYRQRMDLARPGGILLDYVPAAEELDRALRYAHWIDIAARHHVVRARCLHRSLVLHHWLCRDGLPSDLRIGVRKKAGLLQAHAWVELGGRILSDSPLAVATFSRLAPAGDTVSSLAPNA